jgi:hypothetical protein
MRQFAGNGDNWTSGSIYLWGAWQPFVKIHARPIALPVVAVGARVLFHRCTEMTAPACVVKPA